MLDALTRAGMPRHPSFASSRRLAARPPFECIALLLQGGGALGAYQAGVYQALAEADLHPDWVAGISIGAINAAIIAGNPPDERVDKLRAFWEEITANPLLDWAGCSRRVHSQGRPRAQRRQPAERGLRLCSAARRASSPRDSRPLGCTRAAPSRRPASTTPSSSRRRSSGWSTSTASTPARCASASARSTSAPATSSISTTPRTRSAPST